MSGRVAVQPDIYAFFVPFAFFFVSELSRVKKGEIKAFLAVLNSRESGLKSEIVIFQLDISQIKTFLLVHGYQSPDLHTYSN